MTHSMKTRERGFALVELLVAIGIIVILSISLLVQQNKFDSTLQLTNAAYELATVIQEAQRYGTSTFIADGGADDAFGVRFTMGQSEYVLYRTSSNPPADGSEVERYALPRGVEIGGITRNGGTPVSGSISIAFRRPNLEPIFSAGSTTSVTITLSSGELEKEVTISQTGFVQID